MEPDESEESFTSHFLTTFTVLDILGQGTFGCVFEAEKKLVGELSVKCAVKRIPLKRSKTNMDVPLRELNALKMFDHPGIVRFYDAWTEEPPEGWQRWTDEQNIDKWYDDASEKSKELYRNFTYSNSDYFLYMQIELCHSSLADWLFLHGIPVLMRMKFWFKQIVSAVGYIHDQGKIHRDLKPSNILFVGYNQVKVCDLGIVTDIGIPNGDADDERTFGQGTAMYMAPEQTGWSGYSSQVDMFALGLILFEMTTIMSVDDKAKTFDKFRDERTDDIQFSYPEVEKMVKWLTNNSPNLRPSCKELLQHSFLVDFQFHEFLQKGNENYDVIYPADGTTWDEFDLVK